MSGAKDASAPTEPRINALKKKYRVRRFLVEGAKKGNIVRSYLIFYSDRVAVSQPQCGDVDGVDEPGEMNFAVRLERLVRQPFPDVVSAAALATGFEVAFFDEFAEAEFDGAGLAADEREDPAEGEGFMIGQERGNLAGERG